MCTLHTPGEQNGKTGNGRSPVKRGASAPHATVSLGKSQLSGLHLLSRRDWKMRNYTKRTENLFREEDRELRGYYVETPSRK